MHTVSARSIDNTENNHSNSVGSHLSPTGLNDLSLVVIHSNMSIIFDLPKSCDMSRHDIKRPNQYFNPDSDFTVLCKKRVVYWT